VLIILPLEGSLALLRTWKQAKDGRSYWNLIYCDEAVSVSTFQDWDNQNEGKSWADFPWVTADRNLKEGEEEEEREDSDSSDEESQ